MELYMVYMTTELGEEVDVCGITMLEGGELQCDGVICIQCSAVFA